jgi:hypothetical protein
VGEVSQAAEALAKGNEIRVGMAAHRRELRALPRADAFRLAAGWLEEPDEVVGRMRVGYLLESLPRVGRVLASNYIYACGLSPTSFDRRVLTLKNDERRRRYRIRSLNRPISYRSRIALVALLRSEAERIDRGR